MSGIPGDGAVFLNTPSLPEGTRGAAIIREFFDAMGNPVANPNPNWGGFFDFKPAVPADAAINQTINNITNKYETDLSQTNAKLEAILAALKSSTTKSIEDTSRQIQQTIQIGERKISTNAVPILGKLESVTAGLEGFASLNDATVVALMTSIPWSLEFIETQRMAQNNKLLQNIATNALTAPSQIVSGVGAALGDLGRGLLDGISAILSRIEAAIIDPIATLLAAILAAIKTVPARTADAVWDSLLAELPEGAST